MPTPITGQGISASPKVDATLSNTSKNAVQNQAVANALAGAYDATVTYAVGDLCIYDGILYECTTAITTAEAWDATHWKTRNFGEKVSDLNRQLSDIEENQIPELKNAINQKAPLIINSASGDIASFPDGADDMPIKSLVASIEPVQDLHGQDSPYPAGGGKNKCDGIAYDGAISSNIPRISNKTPVTSPHNTSTGFGGVCFFAKVESGKTYALSSDETGSSATFYWAIYSSIDDALNITKALQSGNTNVSFTAEHDGYVLFMRYNSTAGTSVTWTYAQAEVGSSATAYAPYSNICPISGHTGAEIEQARKNLLKPSDFHLNKNYDDSTVIGRAVAIIKIPAGSYTVSRKDASLFREITVARCKKPYPLSDLASGGLSSIVNLITNSSATITINDEYPYVYIICIVNNGEATTENIDSAGMQLELGSTASAYEPFQSNQISVTFPSAAGTVYGGSLTLNPDRTGTLVVDAELEVFNNTSLTNEISSPINFLGNNTGSVDVLGDFTRVAFGGPTPDARQKYNLLSNTYSKMLCNILPHRFSYNDASVHWYRNTVLYAFFPTSLVGNTKQSVIDYLRSIANTTPLSFWIPLATPQTYQLTAEQVSGILATLYGTNNIWSSTGDTEVTYPADTKLYIDRKISEALGG